MNTWIAVVALVLCVGVIGLQGVALGVDLYQCELLTRSGPSCDNPDVHYYGSDLERRRAEYHSCMLEYQSKMMACHQLYMREIIRMQRDAEMEQQSRRLMDMLQQYSGAPRW